MENELKEAQERYKKNREEAELKKRKCCANCQTYHKGDFSFSGYCPIFARAIDVNELQPLIKKYGAIKNRFYCYLFKRIDG